LLKNATHWKALRKTVHVIWAKEPTEREKIGIYLDETQQNAEADFHSGNGIAPQAFVFFQTNMFFDFSHRF